MTTVPELVSELTHIVRDVTGCLTDGGASYSYGHHPGPLTPIEVDRIQDRAESLFTRMWLEALKEAERVAIPQADGDGR